MRHTVSVSLDEQTILKMRNRLRQSSEFRNKSHLVELAIERMLEGDDDE